MAEEQFFPPQYIKRRKANPLQLTTLYLKITGTTLNGWRSEKRKRDLPKASLPRIKVMILKRVLIRATDAFWEYELPNGVITPICWTLFVEHWLLGFLKSRLALRRRECRDILFQWIASQDNNFAAAMSLPCAASHNTKRKEESFTNYSFFFFFFFFFFFSSGHSI